LIAPTRTAGGHRLYATADLDRIAQIKSWQAQGLSLAEIRRRLGVHRQLEPAALAGQFLETALHDTVTASRLVLEADDVGMPLQTVFQDVLGPAMVEVGDRWGAGQLRVGQEHEVTEMTRGVIAELGLRHAEQRPGGRPILAACVRGEQHDLGLRMIVALLRSGGCCVAYLGADVDPRFLVEETRIRRPAAVLLSATTADRLTDIRTAAEALRELAPPAQLPIFLGGQVVWGRERELREMSVTPVTEPDVSLALESIVAIVAGTTLEPRGARA
jgi:methanogenic corrinoid protein MtbC1